MESDLGCTSRIYFYNATLTSKKPCQHNNKCVCSKTNGFSNILLKNHNFIHSVDRTFWVIKIMEINRTHMLQYYFSLDQFRLIKWSFFIHSTMSYIHLKLDSRTEWKFSDWGWHLAIFLASDEMESLTSKPLKLILDHSNLINKIEPRHVVSNIVEF